MCARAVAFIHLYARRFAQAELDEPDDQLAALWALNLEQEQEYQAKVDTPPGGPRFQKFMEEFQVRGVRGGVLSNCCAPSSRACARSARSLLIAEFACGCAEGAARHRGGGGERSVVAVSPDHAVKDIRKGMCLFGGPKSSPAPPALRATQRLPPGTACRLRSFRPAAREREGWGSLEARASLLTLSSPPAVKNDLASRGNVNSSGHRAELLGRGAPRPMPPQNFSTHAVNHLMQDQGQGFARWRRRYAHMPD
jgi:hypothetical protein